MRRNTSQKPHHVHRKTGYYYDYPGSGYYQQTTDGKFFKYDPGQGRPKLGTGTYQSVGNGAYVKVPDAQRPRYASYSEYRASDAYVHDDRTFEFDPMMGWMAVEPQQAQAPTPVHSEPTNEAARVSQLGMMAAPSANKTVLKETQVAVKDKGNDSAEACCSPVKCLIL